MICILTTLTSSAPTSIQFRASEAPRCSPQEDKAAHHTETPPYALVLDDAFSLSNFLTGQPVAPLFPA